LGAVHGNAEGKDIMRARKRVVTAMAALLMVLVAGTIGFTWIEGWSVLDAFFMTVITLSTIGYGEVHPLSAGGRVFTVFIVFLGVGSMAFAVKEATRVMLEGELRQVLGRRKLVKRIGSLSNHYIVCGYGRMGKVIATEFQDARVPFVVIERDQEILSELGDSVLWINGDATQDAVLEAAGVRRAKGLVSVLSSDAENLFVVLSARSMNGSLVIVARAGEDGTGQKLLRAGATKVVSPYRIGGTRIAHAILKPVVVDFLELATKTNNLELAIEELPVAETSPLAGKVITETGLRQDYGVIVIAIKRKGGQMTFNPTKDTRVEAGDTLILLGEGRQMDRIEGLVSGL